MIVETPETDTSNRGSSYFQQGKLILSMRVIDTTNHRLTRVIHIDDPGQLYG